MKTISKKYKQLVINAIGAIGYFGLIFGLTIAIVSVLDWFSLVELSPIDHQLTVNDGRPGEAGLERRTGHGLRSGAAWCECNDAEL